MFKLWRGHLSIHCSSCSLSILAISDQISRIGTCSDSSQGTYSRSFQMLEQFTTLYHLCRHGQVSKSEISKLLIHKIPTSVNSETLHKIVPGDFTIELKPAWNGQVDKYSALAIFKNQREAREAYENVRGSQEKDLNGRPQKLIKCPGINAGVYVRKMGVDNNHKKRDLQEDDT